MVERLPNGGGFCRSGGGHDQTELALGDQLGKVGKTVTSYEIAMALADHMVHRSAKVDTDKFQNALSGIFAMWCIGQRPFQSWTFQRHLVAGQTSTLVLAQGGVSQDRVFGRQ